MNASTMHLPSTSPGGFFDEFDTKAGAGASMNGSMLQPASTCPGGFFDDSMNGSMVQSASTSPGGFFDDFGAKAKAGSSGSKQRRIAPDGVAYTRKEFYRFFGGYVEWDHAQPA